MTHATLTELAIRKRARKLRRLLPSLSHAEALDRAATESGWGGYRHLVAEAHRHDPKEE